MKEVLVIGGAGFIGSHTVELLLQKNISVTVFDNLSTGKLSHLPLGSPLLRFVEADVLDTAALQAEIKRCDAILHLAALPSVPYSLEDPVGSHAINVTGFLQVLQALRFQQRPIRLVYASSSAIYGESAMLPCNDEPGLQYAPTLSPYALQKVQSEQYADLYSRLFNLPSLGLRYFNVYGRRQDPQSMYAGVIARFINQYTQRNPVTILGDGYQSRDFIDVRDVAHANYLALNSDYHGVLNIATGVPQTLRDLTACLEKMGNESVQVAFAAERAGDIRHSYASTQKAQTILGFCHQVSLEDGLRHLLAANSKRVGKG